ncbi:MAG TPA: hypothetical protein VJ726_12420 [Candidatus Limnocylindria bacterium]|nr:hypothetical protein [Candidatus Limnocylindria bacterium]
MALVGALLMACGPGSTPAATPAPTVAAPSSQTPAATATAAASPAATATSARVDVLLKFAPGTNIADVDDITDIVLHLKSTPGIHDGFGDEGQITIVYDPRLVTVEKIRALLEEMSYKTLPPGS